MKFEDLDININLPVKKPYTYYLTQPTNPFKLIMALDAVDEPQCVEFGQRQDGSYDYSTHKQALYSIYGNTVVTDMCIEKVLLRFGIINYEYTSYDERTKITTVHTRINVTDEYGAHT